MAWELEIWWGHHSECAKDSDVKEQFDTKAEGITRAEEILSDGLTVISAGNHHHYPVYGITHVSLIDLDFEEE